MDSVRRKKEKRNADFARGELGALLRLFGGLGVAVAAGIVGFFLLGVHVDRKLEAMGVAARGLPRVAFLLAGVGLSVYWAFLRIARHLERYEPKDGEDGEGGGARDGKGDAGK